MNEVESELTEALEPAHTYAFPEVSVYLPDNATKQFRLLNRLYRFHLSKLTRFRLKMSILRFPLMSKLERSKMTSVFSLVHTTNRLISSMSSRKRGRHGVNTTQFSVPWLVSFKWFHYNLFVLNYSGRQSVCTLLKR